MMKTLASLSLVLLLTACVTPSQDVTPAAKNTGVFGIAKSDMDVTTPKAFAGKKDVIVGNFKVAFITDQKQSNTTRGGMLSSGMAGRATAQTTLTGVSTSAMQSIADTAYSDFVAELKSAGYNVLPTSKLYQSETFSAVKGEATPYESGAPLPGIKADAKIFVPKGQKLLLLTNQGGTFAGFNVGKGSPVVAYTNYATETGTPVLDVFYVVNYAGFGGHRSASSASVKVGHGMSVSSGSSLSLIGGQGGSFSTNNGTITLGQPVGSDKSFASVNEATSQGEKAAGYAVNAVSAVLGGATSIARKYEVQANEGQYKTAARESLAKANDAFVSQMKALR